jgi:hypothetical protein
MIPRTRFRRRLQIPQRGPDQRLGSADADRRRILVTLPKGQAFALLEGGQLWKIRIPLPDDRADAAMPGNFEEMAEAMRRSYITNDHWYRVTEHWWHGVSEATVEPAESSG